MNQTRETVNSLIASAVRGPGGLPLLAQMMPYEVIDDFKRFRKKPGEAMHLIHAWGTNVRPGTSPLASLHERQHDIVLRESVYGFVQRYFRDYTQPGAPKRWRRYGAKWSSALALASNAAHEEAATYLSIKMLNLDDEAAALATMPAAYGEYFHRVSSLIDPYVESSYLQFSLANVMMYLAFDSPILHRLAPARRPVDPIVDETEAPNARLDRVKALVRDVGPGYIVSSVRERVREFALHYVDERDFEIEREADWIAVPPEQRLTLERYLSACIMDWFGAHDNAGVSRVRLADVATDADALLRAASDRNVLFGAFGSGFFDLFWPDQPIDLSVITALSAAESVLLNEPLEPDSVIDYAPAEMFWVEPADRTQAQIAVVCAEELSSRAMPQDWIITVIRRDDAARERIVSRVAIKLPQLRRFLSKGAGEFNDMYVVGLPAPSGDLADELMRSTAAGAMELFKHENAPDSTDERMTLDTHPGMDRLVFYMHGNFLSWVRRFAQFPGARYRVVFLGENDVPNSPPPELTLSLLPRGLAGYVFECDLFPMKFVRFLNVVAFGEIEHLISGFAERNRLFPCVSEPEDRECYGEMLQLALSSIEAVWEVF